MRISDWSSDVCSSDLHRGVISVSESPVPMPMTGKASALGWVSVRHLKHIIARGEAIGLRMDELIDEAGLVRSRLADADGLIPVAVLEGMLTAFARRYSDPVMGDRKSGVEGKRG